MAGKGKERCWVYFKNGLGEKGTWNGGWYGTPSPLGGVLIENFDYVPCRVPEWRVSWEEPKEGKGAPDAPEGADWKLFPVS